MRIIEYVEITKFRSIGEEQYVEALDLNIFSGSNDSGKSNFLKALNLFFNGQTDRNINYNSEVDFNKWFRDNNIRGQRIIEIKVMISKGNFSDKYGINEGFQAKKVYRIDGGFDIFFYTKSGKEINKDALSHRKASAVINEKIKYIYIPTIRDVIFRESVQRQIQEIANSTDKRFKSQDLKDAFVKMELGINNQLKDLTDYVKELMKIDIETNVNFSTLLESLTFDTSEKIKIKKRGRTDLEIQKVGLNNRGEGIQMQFFSFMLWFISKNDTKHYYIWGYEEPEIAFEFKRQFELADVFQKTFAKVAQIFLTTHSPAFAFTESTDKIKVYRVNYEKDKTTKSNRFISNAVPINEYYEGLFKELTKASAEQKKSLERDIWGINVQRISKMIGDSMEEIVGIREISNTQLEELKCFIAEQKQENEALQGKVIGVEEVLANVFPEKIFICEDETGIALWNMLFDKVGLNKVDLKIIPSKGCSNNEVEIAISHLMSSRSSYRPKVFRQLDRDGFLQEQIDFLKKAKSDKYSKFKKYEIEFLPVNEIENFAVLLDPFFTNDNLKAYEINNKITDAFRATISTNILSAQKLCATELEKKIFRNKDLKMIEEARLDILKFFPGKDIKKTKRNFNINQKINNTPFPDFPDELKVYLNKIKIFFETD